MRERSALEVLLTFLNLGVTSFGGPIAHIGYFRETVVRRRWVDDAAYQRAPVHWPAAGARAAIHWSICGNKVAVKR
jgi:hypothetical protein